MSRTLLCPNIPPAGRSSLYLDNAEIEETEHSSCGLSRIVRTIRTVVSMPIQNRSRPFPDRTWRAHALDGALLWFHPGTGLHVRVDAPATRAVRRASPRVVMFGITNHCNLSCGFCSRDIHAGSEWTPDSAYTMLNALARAGVLEVAFGGGEPLAFPGFDDLIARLGESTSLALNFTTNGALLTEERVRRLVPWVGEIRLSIYDDNPWEDVVARLVAAEARFGANVLVTPARLGALPALLHRLASLACRDVALLSYVGPDASLHLTAADHVRLRAIVADSPMRVRISVCFGDRLAPLPRLFDGVGGDCGAGLDFVVLTSDRRLKACSFAGAGISVEAADDVLRVWRERQQDLSRPIEVGGCARPAARTPMPHDGVRVWQGFSGNNSGECVMVGRFDTVEEADRYVTDLLPGYDRMRLSDAWRELLEREGALIGAGADEPPDAIVALARTVMMHTVSPDDAFPSLRTLLWKRGGRSVYAGIHVHDDMLLVAGLGCPDAAALDDVEAELALGGMDQFHRRGRDLFGRVPVGGSNPSLESRAAQLKEIAAKHGAMIAGELIPTEDAVPWPQALAARTPDLVGEHLWVSFPTEEDAARFAAPLAGAVAQISRYVIVEAENIGARLGYRAQREGGTAQVLGAGMCLAVAFWRPRRGKETPPELDAAELATALLAPLRPFLASHEPLRFESEWHTVTGAFVTTDSRAALAVVTDFARGRDLEVWLDAKPATRLVEVLARVATDLRLRQE
jgi:hypothetical protein